MTIEFRCSQCNQLLRVPESAAGKNARCPKCQALMTVPGVATALASTSEQPTYPDSPAAASPPAFGAPSIPQSTVPPPLPPNPFAANQPATNFPPPPAKPPTDNPFAPDAASPHSLNPYASPAATDATFTQFAAPSLPINPRPVSADTIFNYAWEIWKANLGLLVGVTVVIGVANYAVIIPFQALQFVLQQQGEEQAAIGANFIGQFCSNLVQLYLGIGAVQINLKLARRQPAAFSDLFGGIGLFLPLLGGAIIAYLALAAGLLCFIVPGILMMLAYWPFYYLIIDRKAGVMESFSIASRITHGNWASSFVLWIMSVGIGILGCLALCVGLLFAGPLISMMFAVAYLMMSGQLVPYGMYPGYPPPHQPEPAA